jgi:hypothetical protein
MNFKFGRKGGLAPLSPEAELRIFKLTQTYVRDKLKRSVKIRERSCFDQFRIWATQRLKEYIIKGFAMSDELFVRKGFLAKGA